jgi:hypothetical protein
MRAILIIALLLLIALAALSPVIMDHYRPSGGWCLGGKGVVPCKWVPEPLRVPVGGDQ